MHSRYHHIEYPIDRRSSFSCVDSFGSLGHAVIESMTNKLTGPIVFMTDVAIKGLKIAIIEVKNKDWGY